MLPLCQALLSLLALPRTLRHFNSSETRNLVTLMCNEGANPFVNGPHPHPGRVKVRSLLRSWFSDCNPNTIVNSPCLSTETYPIIEL